MNHSFELMILNTPFDDSVEQWLIDNLGYTHSASLQIATSDIPNDEGVVTDELGVAYLGSDFRAGEYFVWVDYNPDTINYEGTTKIKFRLVISKATITFNGDWDIADGALVSVKGDGFYTNILDAGTTTVDTTYYKETLTDEYVEVEKGSHGYAELTRVGYYKSVTFYEIDLNNYDVTMGSVYNGRYSEVANGIEFVSEWRIMTRM